MKQPISTLYKMDTLLQECKTCERRLNNPKYLNPDKVCGGCEIYSQLRKIGEQLEGRKKMGAAIQLTVDQYKDYKSKGYSDAKVADEIGCSAATISNWKNKYLNGSTKQETLSETKNPQTEKQPEEKPSKSRIEVMEMALMKKDEEYQLLKENTVPFGDYATMKNQYEDSEAGRQLYMYKWEQAEGKYQQTFSNLEKMDHELENTREQLRKVRDYNVKATEKIQHLEALLVMYMGEGKENVSDSN